jgi:ribosome biogenesis GTPase
VLRAGEREVEVALPGRLKKGPRETTAPLVVGDRVRLAWEGETARILDRLERDNEVARVDSLRPPRKHVLAANVDQVVCVVSVAQPPFQPRTLDRLLLLGEVAGIPSLVCLNKQDLLAASGRDAVADPPMEVYRQAGYEVVRTSATEGTGLDALRQRLKDRTSLLVGPSGVGKSTLLNQLVPGAGLRTREVSRATGRGVHTTTRVEWLDLPEGGVLLDTPGLRHIRPWGLEPANLGSYFPEIRELQASCRFRNCLHRAEPGCAVREALDDPGEPRRMRYLSYLRILESLERNELW